MQQLADHGSGVFYLGSIADAIVSTVRKNNRNPGLLNHEDLANYAVKERPAICTKFRNLRGLRDGTSIIRSDRCRPNFRNG